MSGEGGRLEHSHIAAGIGKWCSHCKKQFDIELPQEPTPRYVPKRTENMCLHKNLCLNVHSCFICNNQKVETTQMSIN